MRAMGLQPREKVQYGRAFLRTGDLDETAARRAEALAKRLYPWVQLLPKGRSSAGRALTLLMSSLSVR